MESSIANRLMDLNRQFYQTFGEAFSSTRGAVQPGVRRMLDQLHGSETILDLGCGNGNLVRALAVQGHRAPLVGLDFSLPLLEAAAAGAGGFPVRFFQADLTTDWDAVLRTQLSGDPAFSALLESHFSLITAFAVLHHIPSAALRLGFCRRAAGWLRPGGRFILSNWQFLNSPKLRARIQPWSSIGLSEAQVDPGDALLDWRSGGRGLRYVHSFDPPALEELAGASGFRVLETFYSDGQGGRLGLYQVWELSAQTG